jgi:hypothetical protein
MSDAIDLARQLNIAENMQQAARDLENNRVGQALFRETHAADAIEQVLDVLRNRTDLRPDQLAEKLRAAERGLAALRASLAELREQFLANEQRTETAEAPSEIDGLHQRQKRVREQIARLARELARLQAKAAGDATQRAAERLSGNPPDESQRSDSGRVERAERDLEEAARQLARRREQAEEDWSRRFLEQFKVELAAMVDGQRAVIRTTAELDATRDGNKPLAFEQQRTVEELTVQERKLADDAHVQSEMLSGLRVFGVALNDAVTQLNLAADQLDKQNTGKTTQNAERRALDRFEQIVGALDQAAARQSEPSPAGGQGGQADGGGGQRPLFDLFQVKLLRMLQADLNQRTQDLEARQDRDDDVEHQAAELATEQGRLAELVEQLISRNNADEEIDE